MMKKWIFWSVCICAVLGTGCKREQKGDDTEAANVVPTESVAETGKTDFEYEDSYDIRIRSTSKDDIHYTRQLELNGVEAQFIAYGHMFYLNYDYTIPYLKDNDIIYIDYPTVLPDEISFYIEKFEKSNEAVEEVNNDGYVDDEDSEITYDSFKRISDKIIPKVNEDGNGYYIDLSEYELEEDGIYGIDMYAYWEETSSFDLEDKVTYYFMFGISDEDKANITDITKVE